MIRCYVCYNIYRWVSLQPDVSHVSDENFAMASGLVTPAAVNAPVGFQHGAKLGLWKWNSIWDHMQYHWYIYIFFYFFWFWLFTLEFLFWGSTELADLFLPPFRQLIAKINPQPILLRQRGNPSTTVDGSQKWRIFHHRRLQVMSIGMFLLGWRDGATLTTKNWWFRKIYPLVN